MVKRITPSSSVERVIVSCTILPIVVMIVGLPSKAFGADPQAEALAKPLSSTVRFVAPAWLGYVGTFGKGPYRHGISVGYSMGFASGSENHQLAFLGTIQRIAVAMGGEDDYARTTLGGIEIGYLGINESFQILLGCQVGEGFLTIPERPYSSVLRSYSSGIVAAHITAGYKNIFGADIKLGWLDRVGGFVGIGAFFRFDLVLAAPFKK